MEAMVKPAMDVIRKYFLLKRAAIQEQLKRRQANRKGGKAEPVEFQAGIAGSILEENGQHDAGGDAERHVDVEHPAPIIDVGQDTAQGRTQDRTQHHPHAPYRHHIAALAGRIHVQHHSLGHRTQRRTEHALDQAK